MFEKELKELNDRRSLMLKYLELKMSEEDFHGVADAAMDLRDIDCEILGFKKAGEILNEQK